jgi:hypothetical protein
MTIPHRPGPDFLQAVAGHADKETADEPRGVQGIAVHCGVS